VFVVDTNVLVYAANEESPEHDGCRRLIDDCRLRSLPWYLTWGVVYEFLRVCTHPRVFRRPWDLGSAWAFVEAVVAAPALRILVPTDRHPEVATITFRELPHLRGNLVHDARTAVLMREHGVRRIVTRDTDFHRFPFLEVVDPLTGDVL
jgi:toxin-antitoxin system PIN domain toxin